MHAWWLCRSAPAGTQNASTCLSQFQSEWNFKSIVGSHAIWGYYNLTGSPKLLPLSTQSLMAEKVVKAVLFWIQRQSVTECSQTHAYVQLPHDFMRCLTLGSFMYFYIQVLRRRIYTWGCSSCRWHRQWRWSSWVPWSPGPWPAAAPTCWWSRMVCRTGPCGGSPACSDSQAQADWCSVFWKWLCWTRTPKIMFLAAIRLRLKSATYNALFMSAKSICYWQTWPPVADRCLKQHDFSICLIR